MVDERDGKLRRVELDSAEPGDAGWAAMNVGDYLDEQSPVEVSFEKGWLEVILRVLVSISRATGPLVLVADTGDPPIVVSEDTDVHYVLASLHT